MTEAGSAALPTNYRRLSGSSQGKVNSNQGNCRPLVDGLSGGRNSGIWESLVAASPEHDTKRAMQSRHLMMLGMQPFQNVIYLLTVP